MRLAPSHSRLLRRAGARDLVRGERRIGARMLITALLSAIAPATAAARASDDLSALGGALAEHSETGDEQSVGEMMATIDAVRRAIAETAPGDRRTLAMAIRRAGEV
jgi:hypothetical protein